MSINKISGFATLLSLMVFCGEAHAQTYIPLPQAGQNTTQPQLDQLLAPIALYPDALVGQILIAAGNPVQVVEAERWLQQPENAGLTSDQLSYALQQQPWDLSVKSLVPFPQVLGMMDANLTWTQQIGQAFASSQPAVMDSIQRLRAQARAAGSLISTPQQTVGQQDGAITIAPVNSGLVYVPCYAPGMVYGPWANSAYPPTYLSQPDGCNSQYLSFSPPVTVIDSYWGWNDWDWRHHHVNVDRDRDRFRLVTNTPRPPAGTAPQQGRPITYNSPQQGGPRPIIYNAPSATGPVTAPREPVKAQSETPGPPTAYPPSAPRMNAAAPQAPGNGARPMANAVPQNSDAHGQNNNADAR